MVLALFVGCSDGRRPLGQWPPSLGKLSVTKLVLEPSTCPTGWAIAYAYEKYGHTTMFQCTPDPTNLQAPGQSFEISDCCATILDIGLSGPTRRDMVHGLDQIAPLLEPSVVAGLRASLSDDERLRHAAELGVPAMPTIWPNVEALYYEVGLGAPDISWNLEPFFPDDPDE